MVEPSVVRPKADNMASTGALILLDFGGKSFTFPKSVQDRFFTDKKIAEGAFGAVFECYDLFMNVKCVIKIVSFSRF
jgi:hypothetical protein